MLRKIISMRFLLLGISAFLVLMSCNTKKVDAKFKADWVYKNASTHKIEVRSRDNFTLTSGQTHSIFEEGEGSKNIKPENYVSPQWGAETIIIVDDGNEYILSKGESITEVMNYEAEKIKHNYYRFTYTFTDEILQSFKD